MCVSGKDKLKAFIDEYKWHMLRVCMPSVHTVQCATKEKNGEMVLQDGFSVHWKGCCCSYVVSA